MSAAIMEYSGAYYDYSDYGNGSLYGYEYGYGPYAYQDWMNYNFPEELAAQKINLYLPPFLLLIGTTGNILSAVVLSRLTSRVVTTCFYLTLMAVVDTLLLYIRCGNVWVRELFNLDITMKIMSRSDALCQVYSFISNFVLHLCAWLLVAAVIESCIITLRPMKAHKICNLDRAKNVLLLEVLLLVCVNAHFFWTYGLEQDHVEPSIYYCTFSTFGSHYSEYFRNIVWPIMDLLSSSVVPGCIILAGIIYSIRRIHCKKNDGASILENTFLLDARATHQLVMVTLILGIFSLIFTAPETGYNLFEFILERADLLGSTMDFDSKRRLAQAICISSRDFFLSCKIFFYIASWESFRNELTNLFRRMKHVKKILPSKSRKGSPDICVDDNMPCLSSVSQA